LGRRLYKLKLVRGRDPREIEFLIPLLEQDEELRKPKPDRESIERLGRFLNRSTKFRDDDVWSEIKMAAPGRARAKIIAGVFMGSKLANPTESVETKMKRLRRERQQGVSDRCS
jgi:hypothetical protein